MPLPSDFLDRIKDANRLDEVMRSYVTLKRTGRDYKCLCPFHSEKTPSCVVHPDEGYFHCFGCGAGGDVITFTMKIENLDYMEAIKLLAGKASIPLPEDGYDDKAASWKKRLLEMNKVAAKFFYSNLKTPEGKEGLRYLLEKRHLKPETIKKFGLGVATNHWTALYNHMTALGYTPNELERASLIGRTQEGRNYDFFVNRIMFPIFDLRGNIIAFTGRSLDVDPKGAKYKNSRETDAYKKAKTLFALNFAKNDSVKSKRLILCEGNVDVITLHQAGFTEAVATCGTAITAEHARLMSQYCDEVYICYDSDAAGQKATTAAINILSAAGLASKVINVTAEGVKDVDDYINIMGPARFKNLIDGSQGAIAYELNSCKNGLDLDGDLGKVEYMKRAVKVLASIESRIEREVYTSRVANEMGIKTEILNEEVKAAVRKLQSAYKKQEWRELQTASTKRDDINPEAKQYPKEAKAEEGIIAYIFKHPDKVAGILQKISSGKFVTSFNKRVYEQIEKLTAQSKEITLTGIGQEFSGDEMGRITGILARSSEIVIDEETLKEYINVLITHSDTANAAEMSDDEFLAYVQKQKQSKGN